LIYSTNAIATTTAEECDREDLTIFFDKDYFLFSAIEAEVTALRAEKELYAPALAGYRQLLKQECRKGSPTSCRAARSRGEKGGGKGPPNHPNHSTEWGDPTPEW